MGQLFLCSHVPLLLRSRQPSLSVIARPRKGGREWTRRRGVRVIKAEGVYQYFRVHVRARLLRGESSTRVWGGWLSTRWVGGEGRASRTGEPTHDATLTTSPFWNCPHSLAPAGGKGMGGAGPGSWGGWAVGATPPSKFSVQAQAWGWPQKLRQCPNRPGQERAQAVQRTNRQAAPCAGGHHNVLRQCTPADVSGQRGLCTGCSVCMAPVHATQCPPPSAAVTVLSLSLPPSVPLSLGKTSCKAWPAPAWEGCHGGTGST